MSELAGGIEEDYRAEWIRRGRPLPLEVCRSGYDDEIVSWEVLYWDSPWDGNSGCQSPIAEFTTWREAQDWASSEARKSTLNADHRRTLGPKTAYQQAHEDAWASYSEGAGPDPFTTDRERMALL